MDAEPEIERAGSAFKSLVWKHFGFVKSDTSKVINQCIVIEQETFVFIHGSITLQQKSKCT